MSLWMLVWLILNAGNNQDDFFFPESPLTFLKELKKLQECFGRVFSFCACNIRRSSRKNVNARLV